MGNMGYCRFENTYHDLIDCWENFEDPQSERSESEQRYCDKLVKLCEEIAEGAM